MKVELITYTPDALEILLLTKNTRLTRLDGSPLTLAHIVLWSEKKKMEELEYMRNTISSSWEFVDYIFLITEVTRAFTHQLVRHRIGTSFAQQSQRAVDMSGFDYVTPPNMPMEAEDHYHLAMIGIDDYYKAIISQGAERHDARGVLPTNIETSIIFKANLRTLSDMGLVRLCVKAQGEFQDVFREIRARVTEVHPWAEGFIKVWCAKHGTCCFPAFPVKDCPTKPIVWDPVQMQAYDGCSTPGRLEDIEKRWEHNRAEAKPKAEEL